MQGKKKIFKSNGFESTGDSVAAKYDQCLRRNQCKGRKQTRRRRPDSGNQWIMSWADRGFFFWIGFKGNCWRSDLKLSTTFHRDIDRKEKAFCQRCTMADHFYSKFICASRSSQIKMISNMLLLLGHHELSEGWLRDKLRTSEKLCLDGLSQTTTDDHHNLWRRNLFSHIGIKVLMILVILQSLHLLQISKIKRPLLRIKKKKKRNCFCHFWTLFLSQWTNPDRIQTDWDHFFTLMCRKCHKSYLAHERAA